MFQGKCESLKAQDAQGGIAGFWLVQEGGFYPIHMM